MAVAEPDRMAELRDVFDEYDENGDGEISAAELDNAMLACGHVLLDEELAAIMTRFNADAKAINFDEFCMLADPKRAVDSYADRLLRTAIHEAFPKAKRASAPHAERTTKKPALRENHAGLTAFFDLFEDISEAFATFDENGDGAITETELGNVLRSLGQAPSQADLHAMFRAFDGDGNGTIEYEEFCDMVVAEQLRPEGVDSRLIEMVSTAARRAVGERRQEAAGAS